MEQFKRPEITPLDFPEIKTLTTHLPLFGRLAITRNSLVHLDIDDHYIHHLFPVLQPLNAQKPNYFNDEGIGAHISVIYPEEKISFDLDDLHQTHYFEVRELVKAEINQKIYFALLVKSHSLQQLRDKYNLPNLLNFKGYSIPFHITIGTKAISNHDNVN